MPTPRFPRLSVVLLAIVIICGLASCGKSPQESIQAGNALVEQKKYAEAVINYRNALQKDGLNAEAHYRLGLALLRQRDIRGAAAELQQAINLDPKKTEWKIELADLSLSAYLDNPMRPRVLYEQVQTTSRTLLEQNPQSYDGLRLRGQIALLDRRFPEAAADLEQALRQKPDAVEIQVAQAQALLQIPDKAAEGEALAKRLLQNNLQLSVPYEILAAYYLETKQEAKAEEILRQKLAHMQDNPNAYAQMADFYDKTKRPAEAAKVIESLLARQDKIPSARRAVGDYYVRLRNAPKALENYQIALQREPVMRLLLWQRIALLHSISRNEKETLAAVEEILKINPNDTEGLALRATMNLDRNRPDEALADAQNLQRINPNESNFSFLAGKVQLARGEYDLARAAFEKAATQNRDDISARLELARLAMRSGVTSEVLRYSGEVLQKAPGLPEALLIRSQMRFRRGDWSSARQDLASILRKEPNNFEARLQMALLAANEGKIAEAEPVFQKYYRPGQPDLRPVSGLVLCLERKNQTAKALELLRKELPLQPKNNELRLLYANTLAATGDLAEAEKEFVAMAQTGKKDAAVQMSLARFLSTSRKKPEDAEKYYRAAYALSKEQDGQAAAGLAAVLQQLGRGQEAVEIYKKLLQQEPNNPQVLNNLAFELAEQGKDLASAMNYAKQAAAQLPNQPQIIDTIAAIHLKQDEVDQALRLLEPLAGQPGKDASILYHLGLGYRKKGDSARAERSLRAALDAGAPKLLEDKIRATLESVGAGR